MVLHIDQTLSVWVDQYGAWVYPVLFLIVFAETGLVVLPFLPAIRCSSSPGRWARRARSIRSCCRCCC